MSERNLALLEWYDAHARALPWRETIDPYPVLVSEVMLQQTQVERVVERHRRFLERFPTVHDLAAAPMAAVLSEWSGLGYNRRAQRLHAAARAITDDGWPSTMEGLQALPGVGPYTAAAVASICFGTPVAAVDTNLRRVLSRWHGSPLDAAEASEFAHSVMDADRPGDWNQALMDLGAALCRPRAPSCERCPVETWCTDAAIYVAPRPQGAFEGSSRQARGAVIRLLLDGPLTVEELLEGSELTPERLACALTSLGKDALIVRRGPRYRLA